MADEILSGAIEISTNPTTITLSDGSTVELDTTIDPATLSPRAVPFNLRFSQRITDEEAVQFNDGVVNINYKLQGYGYPGHYDTSPSLDAVIDGSTISYELPWGHIKYQVLPTGIKEEIIIESNTLSDPTSSGISLDGLTVDIDFGLPPSQEERPLLAYDSLNHSLTVIRTQTGISIPYEIFARARLPLVIDPTILTASNQCYVLMETYDNTGFILGTGIGSPLASTHIGTSIETDSKGTVTGYNSVRFYGKIDLSSCVGYTIQATPIFQVYNSVYVTPAQVVEIQEIADWGPNNPLFFTQYSFKIGYTNNAAGGYCTATSGAGDLKPRLLAARAGSTKKYCYLIHLTADDANATTFTNSIYALDGVTNTPKLVFNGYNTFTQNAVTAIGNNQVTVNWTNGGGLVSGDKHRIYYSAGSGKTAAQIIAGGTYVETTSYTATNKIVNGLTTGTTYQFVVVDVQMVGTTAYEGAASSVQTITTDNSGTPTNSAYCIIF